VLILRAWRFWDHWLFRPGLGFARAKTIDILRDRPAKGRYVELSLAREAGVRTVYALTRRLPRKSVDLTLDPDLLLTREISIPKAARKDAEAIVALDTAENTPFDADQVTWTLGRWTRDGTRLQATQYLVRRDMLRAITDAVDGAGSTVQRVRLRSRQDLAPLIEVQPTNLSAREAWSIAAGAALLIAVTLSGWSAYLTRSSLRAEIASIEQGNDALRAEALRLQEALSTRDEQLAELRAAVGFLDENGNRLPLLAQLTKALGDDVSVSDFRVQGGKVTLTAQADGDGFAVLETVTGLNGVREAQLTAPIMADPRSNRERVQMEIALSDADNLGAGQ